MKAFLVLAGLFLMVGVAAAEDKISVEKELLKIRQNLSTEFAGAVAKGEAKKAVEEHYTPDVVLKSLCPEQPPIIGRDTYLKHLQGLVKGNLRDYVSTPKEAYLIGNDRAWTSGTYSFTINDKQGKPVHWQGTWFDMLRREGNVWKVSFQAFARMPCPN